MNIRRWISVPISLASLALAAAGLYAQAKAAPDTSNVEHITVHGQALEGNLEGDSPDRDVTVYLPPSYATDRARRYPVVYLLHGYGGTESNWTGRQVNLPEIADKLFAARSVREMIVVMPNAFSLHKGSMYSSSVTSGDWETYVARNLVVYVDGRVDIGQTLREIDTVPVPTELPVRTELPLRANPAPRTLAFTSSASDSRAGRRSAGHWLRGALPRLPWWIRNPRGSNR